MLGNAMTNDGRDGVRSNMFIAAVLRWAQGDSPIRLRNMSAQGALIETAAMPGEGTAVELVRGRLRAHGKLVWTAGNRGGIRLDSTIDIADWIAPPGNSGQVRVDRMIRDVRDSGRTGAPRPDPRPGPVDAAEMARLVEGIAEQLASDPAILVRHSASLQQLDRIRQALEQIAAR